MGMSIDDSIKYFTSMSRCYLRDYEYLSIAVDTMRKYQYIQEIYKSWRTGDYKGSTECMEEIGEVLKDGNVD